MTGVPVGMAFFFFSFCTASAGDDRPTMTTNDKTIARYVLPLKDIDFPSFGTLDICANPFGVRFI
jgi:hypothetical protein